MTAIREIPTEERPRERLRMVGPEVLSTVELLAIVLGSGGAERSVVELATALLARFGSLGGVGEASISELCRVPGIGPAKATQLKAAFALAKRVQGPAERGAPIRTAAQAFAHLRPHLADGPAEQLVVLLLDVRSRPMGVEQVALGGLGQVEVEPRQVFHPAVRHGAAALILAHNHPSGDPTPSQEDIELTEELVRIGEMMQIPVKDHLVVAGESYCSIATGCTSRRWRE